MVKKDYDDAQETHVFQENFFDVWGHFHSHEPVKKTDLVFVVHFRE